MALHNAQQQWHPDYARTAPRRSTFAHGGHRGLLHELRVTVAMVAAMIAFVVLGLVFG